MGQKYWPKKTLVMTVVKRQDDINHLTKPVVRLVLEKFAVMLLSKSFGYALRGLLYVALLHDENRKVQIEEIATQLSVPKHFLGKVMQQLVKAGLLQSTKGPNGGFSLTEKSLSTPLTGLLEMTKDIEQFRVCVLKLKTCDSASPCPLHGEIEEVKNRMLAVFQKTTINDLLTGNKNSFLKSIAII